MQQTTPEDSSDNVDCPKLNRLLAGVLAFRGDAEPGPTLERLDGALGRPGFAWMSYYLKHTTVIHQLVQQYRPTAFATSSSLPNQLDSDVFIARSGSSSTPTKSRRKRKLSSSPEMPSRRSERTAKVPKQAPVETKVHHSPPSGPEPVEPEHRQAIAEWCYSHGDRWEDMTNAERWTDFAEKPENKIRTVNAWRKAYDRWLDDIEARIQVLKEESQKSKGVEAPPES